MNDILSPEQIAELVAAAQSGDLPSNAPAAARRQRRVREIDFSRPTKLSPAEQRRFERAHAPFCRTASVRLSTELRSTIEVEVINSAQLTWATALRDAPQPSLFGIATLAPLDTKMAMCIEQGLVFRMIERLIGGGSAESPVNRGPTEIEMVLARRIFASLIAQLSVVWQDLFGLSVELDYLESQNARLEIVPPSEPTLVLTLETRDEGTSSTLSLLVPYSSIANAEKSLSGKSSEERPTDEAASVAVQAALQRVDVELRAEVGAIEMTIGEVLALAEGDLLRLGEVGNGGVYLGTQRLTGARPGRSGKRRAVQVTDPNGVAA